MASDPGTAYLINESMYAQVAAILVTRLSEFDRAPTRKDRPRR